MDKEVNVFPVHDYTEGNEDDITEAVHALDYFTKNWCMNCAETKKLNEPIFRCLECEFNISPETGDCSIKKFAYNHKHGYPMKNFGSMGSL